MPLLRCPRHEADRISHQFRQPLSHHWAYACQIYIRIIREFERQVNICISNGEAGIHDANNGVIFVDELEGPSDDQRIGVEMSLPEPIAKHNDRLRILTVWCVRRDDGAPQMCGNAEVIPASPESWVDGTSSGKSSPVVVRFHVPQLAATLSTHSVAEPLFRPTSYRLFRSEHSVRSFYRRPGTIGNYQ